MSNGLRQYLRSDARWLTAMLVIVGGLSLPAARQAFAGGNIVQDDARVHIAWMARLISPTRFPNDIISDYYQAAAPVGLTCIYKSAAALGVQPLLFSKLLPFALIFAAAGFIWAATRKMFGSPAIATVAAVFYTQELWMRDDVPTGAARAFAPVLTAAFVFWMVRRRALGMSVVMIAQALVYPPLAPALILAAIGYGIRRGERGWRWGDTHAEIALLGGGIAAAAVALIVFAGRLHTFEPLVTVAQARVMPEFGELGRAEFFVPSAFEFWVWGERSGLLPNEWRLAPIVPPFIVLSLAFPPIAMWIPALRRQLPEMWPLVCLMTASAIMYVAAHVSLFHLYLPSRHIQHSLRLVVAIIAAATLVRLVERWLEAMKGRPIRRKLGWTAVGIAVAGLTGYPFALNARAPNFFPNARYVVGNPTLQGFVGRLPENARIAALDEEADHIPALAQRTILVGRESAIPYHSGYYNEMRRRAKATVAAFYTTDVNELKRYVETFGVTHIVLSRAQFEPDAVALNDWVRQFQPEAARALKTLESGEQPALARVAPRCIILETEHYLVLDTSRIE